MSETVGGETFSWVHVLIEQRVLAKNPSSSCGEAWIGCGCRDGEALRW